MKICIVTDTFPPEINGVAKTLCQISQDLKVLGHFVTIICPQQRGEKLNWKNIVKSFAQELNKAYLENISYESNR
jgi:hypothetical protein